MMYCRIETSEIVNQNEESRTPYLVSEQSQVPRTDSNQG